MNTKINKLTNLNITIDSDDNELNDFLFCWDNFNSRPNKIILHNYYSLSLINELMDELTLDNNVITEVIPTMNGLLINDKKLIKIKETIFCSYLVIDRNSKDSLISEMIIYYKSDEDIEYVESIIEMLNDCISDYEEETIKGINILTTNGGVLTSEIIEIEDNNDIKFFYSKNTFSKIKKLIKSINKESGLNIIYGERGLGKTSMIDYIASKTDNDILVINHNMLEHTINNPEFKTFLDKYNNPLLIIDDCENILYDYYNKSNIITSNIIQMIDGLLAYNILLIYNIDDVSDIDENLLELNNLNNIVEFNYLTKTESKKLSELLGFNKSYENNMKLLDIIKNKQIKVSKNFGL